MDKSGILLLFVFYLIALVCGVEWEILSSSSPRATLAHNFIDVQDAQHVLDLAGCSGEHQHEEEEEPLQENHPIIHSIAEQGDHVICRIRERLSKHLNLPLNHFEPVFVLEYRPGMTCDTGQSMPHFDWNCPEGSTQDANDGAIGCPQLRLVTSLIYLNTLVGDENAGRTVLPKAGISVTPKAGSCFAWFNANEELQKDPAAQHYGECLVRQEGDFYSTGTRKFVAVQWIRASPLDTQEVRTVCDEDPEYCDMVKNLIAAVERDCIDNENQRGDDL